MRMVSFLKNLPRGAKIILIIVIILLLLEAVFDLFEILVGQVMVATNDYRPKIGRLWREEEKDEVGQSKVSSLLDSLSQIPTFYRKIRNLQDLRDYLYYKSQLHLSREEFTTLYRTFSSEEAGRLMDASMLYDLSQISDWQSVRLTYADDKVTMLFLDSYGQPIWNTYAFIGDLTHLDGQGQLQNDVQFRGRIVEGRLFSLAYEKLNYQLRLQIINNPRLYELWRNRLLQVGIAPKARSGTVEVAFEVIKGAGTEIIKMQASELAVSYLLVEINQIAPGGQTISMPEKED